MTKDVDAKDFSVSASEGRTTWYTPEGELKNYVVVEKGKIVEQGFYLNGKLRLLEREPIGQSREGWGYRPDGTLFLYAKQKESEPHISPHIVLYGKLYGKDGKVVVDGKLYLARSLDRVVLGHRSDGTLFLYAFYDKHQANEKPSITLYDKDGKVVVDSEEDIAPTDETFEAVTMFLDLVRQLDF